MERITKDLVEKYRPIVHDLMIRGYFPYETVHISFFVSKDPEAQEQLLGVLDHILMEELSLLARRAEDEQIIGVAINKINTKLPPGEVSYFEHLIAEKVTNASARAVVDFMTDDDCKVDLFEEMNVDRIVEIMCLCVLPEARGAGVGKALMSATEALARQLNIPALSAYFTADSSQAIAKAAGFQDFLVYPHSKCIYKGVPISEYLRDDQQCTKLCGKILT